MSESELSAGSAAVRILRNAQIIVTGGTASNWQLRLPDGTHRVADVKILNRNPSPSGINAMLGRASTKHLLIIHETDSGNLAAAARDGLVDTVNIRTGAVTIGGTEWAPAISAGATKRSVKPAWGRWAVMRALYLSKESLTQAELAEFVGVAQPRISQALREIESVERDDRGWYATDFVRLLKTWNESYTGPGGTSTYWYGLHTVVEQATAAAELAEELDIRHLVGGDTAADEYAPWRLPARAQIYIEELVDFSVIKLAQAEPGEATLVATVPDDPTIWRTAKLFGSSPKLADPLITVWDVLKEAGPDAEEAAAKVLERFQR